MAATSNTELTSSWVKIAASTNDEFLASSHGSGAVEFAVTAADAAPTIAQGHVLQPGDALTRGTVGTGYVWARRFGSYPAGVVLVVTK